MTASLVQSKSGSTGSSNASSATVTSSSTTAGNLLVAFVWVQGTSNVTLTAPSGWSQVGSSQGSGAGNATCGLFYYANNPGSLTSHVFSFSSSVNAAVAFEEWSGVATSSPLDQDVAQKNAQGTSTTTGTTATLAGSGELAVWGAGVGATNPITYSSVTNSYTWDSSAQADSSQGTRANANLFYNTSVGTAGTSSGATASGTGANGNTTILAVFKTGTATSHDWTVRGRISQSSSRDIVTRGKISGSAAHDITVRGRISQSARRDWTVRGRLSQTSIHDFVTRGRITGNATHDFGVRGRMGLVTSRDFTIRGRISGTIEHDVTVRGRISQNTSRDFSVRGRTGLAGMRDVTTRGRISGNISHDWSVRGRIAAHITYHDWSVRGRLSQTALGHDVSVRGRLSQTVSHDVAVRGRLGLVTSRDFAVRGRIATGSPLSGGFALFANGTGTASFDHLRVSQYPDPSLALAPVLPCVGTSAISWDATTPTNTTLTVQTSTDGVNWSAASSGTSIAGLVAQFDPIIDLWAANTSATYTSTALIGGSVATALYDTANSRLILSGGSGALYLNAFTSASAIDLLCDMDESDAGGLVWRYQGDHLNYYELGAYDDSASSGFTNQLRLYKVSAGVRSLLGSPSAITWPRSTPDTSPYRRVRVTMLGSVISVYFDGTLMQSYTDPSPLGAGVCGLRNDGGTSRYYQLRIQPQGSSVSGNPAGDTVSGTFVYTKVTMSTTDPSVTPHLLDLTTSVRSPQVATGALITQLHDPSLPFAAFMNAEMDSLVRTSGDYFWHVDNQGFLTFQGRPTVPAPFCLYSTDLLFSPQVTPQYSADLYRNRQIITNCLGLVTVTNEQKIADGKATSWSMAYALYSAPTITVQGVAQTVGVQGTDTGKQFYWTAGSHTINQDLGAPTVPETYLISVSYVGQFPTTVTQDNVAEQAARQAIEGGTGIVTAIEDGKGMLESNAVTRAQGLLARYGNNETVEVVMTTERAGLAPGMVVPTFLPEHHLNNRQLLIVKTDTTVFQQADGTLVYQYTIDATDGPNLNNWSAAILS